MGILIRDAIERAGVLSCVGYLLRYGAAAQATRQFCAGKAIGLVACDRWGGVPGDAGHWWRRMEISGGQLHEMATHQLDLIRWFAGEITEVHKREARLINREPGIGLRTPQKVDEDARTYDSMKGKVMEEMKKVFRPEFLNRVDETIVFHALTSGEIFQIVDLMVERVAKQVTAQGNTA